MQIWTVKKEDRIGEGFELIGVGLNFKDADEIREQYFKVQSRENDRVVITECSTGSLWNY